MFKLDLIDNYSGVNIEKGKVVFLECKRGNYIGIQRFEDGYDEEFGKTFNKDLGPITNINAMFLHFDSVESMKVFKGVIERSIKKMEEQSDE